MKWETSGAQRQSLFPPPYVPHRVPLLYDGEEVALTRRGGGGGHVLRGHAGAEGVHGQPHLQRQLLQRLQAPRSAARAAGAHQGPAPLRLLAHPPPRHGGAGAQEGGQEGATRRRAKAEKEEKERLQDIYGFALVDGYKEKVGNFRVEPPGLFRGREAPEDGPPQAARQARGHHHQHRAGRAHPSSAPARPALEGCDAQQQGDVAGLLARQRQRRLQVRVAGRVVQVQGRQRHLQVHQGAAPQAAHRPHPHATTTRR